MLDLMTLQNAEAAKFSIYIHSKPGFVFDESTTVSEFFYNRQLSMCIQVINSWTHNNILDNSLQYVIPIRV